MSTSPIQAVNPGIPSAPSAVEGGASSGSSLRRRSPSTTPDSHQPRRDVTQSPGAKASWRESTTRPTAPPSIGSPTSNGPTYVRMPVMRLRMYGSTDTKTFRTTTSPAPGSRAGASRSSKSDSFGSPCGRAARITSRVMRACRPPRLRAPSAARRPGRARPSSSPAGRRPRSTARSAAAGGRCRRRAT